MAPDTDWSGALQALVALEGQGGEARNRALRRVTREATISRIDTARVLVEADRIPSRGSSMPRWRRCSRAARTAPSPA